MFFNHKEWKYAICRKMDRARDYRSKLSQLQKNKPCMLSLICEPKHSKSIKSDMMIT